MKSAIVTGGLRGLGLAMAKALLADGWHVLACGHIETDIAPFMNSLPADQKERARAAIGDIRKGSDCDALVATARRAFSRIDLLVNNAGLTFTFADPERFRRGTMLRFWEIADETIQAVMDTNFMGAQQMSARIVPIMLAQGSGHIVNVTTKLDTMNREGSGAYGASKAALEMATEIWAKELAGTGIRVNIVNPGMGADTPGMAIEMRDKAKAGQTQLLAPDDMGPPLVWLASEAARDVHGWRIDANLWDRHLDPRQAMKQAGRPVGLTTHAPL